MHVLFVTSEVAPFFKRGGLGDVSSALPIALSKIGLKVSVVMPFYASIPIHEVKNVGQMSIDFNGRRQTVFIFATVLPGSCVTLYLFRHHLFDEYQSKDMPQSFAFFSRAVAHLHIHAPDIIKDTFDVIHANDWHTALTPLLIGENNKLLGNSENAVAHASKTVFTIHNMLYQGETGEQIIEKLGKPESLFHILHTYRGRKVNFLREALEYADLITTVSPTYAREILTPEFGRNLYDVLLRRRDSVRGILNGIDVKVWDPANDRYLMREYTVRSVHEAKKVNRADLRKEVGLPESDVPVLGFVGRLERKQKGVDLVRQVVRDFPKGLMQLVVLGTGDLEEVELLEELASTRRDFVFFNRFDERLAHKIYAGADIMLIPSKFEPCGLIQMIAMRYGTIPLVRRTGGLADTVRERVTGFVFRDYTKDALSAKIRETLAFKKAHADTWSQMIERVMHEDFSWQRSAIEYRQLYQSLFRSSTGK